MSDEDIIKRKLLFDGDGTGDDRRLNLMLKMFAKWAQNSKTTPAENQIMYDKIISQLNLCEYSRKKSQVMRKKNQQQLQQYLDFQKNMKNKINEVQKCINMSKVTLTQMKMFKKNKITYDNLACTINKQPTRTETISKISKCQMELNDLYAVRSSLVDKYNSHKKLFHVTIESTNKLRILLENDKSDINDSEKETDM